jgi:uncharacterized iron-regulated protein
MRTDEKSTRMVRHPIASVWLTLALISLLVIGLQATPHSFGSPSPTQQIGSMQSLTLWDVEARQQISLEQASSRLSGSEIVLVGEMHDRLSHHEGQLQVIRSIHETGKAVAVGLEMFKRRDQSVLDRWISGQLDEHDFEVHFRDSWGDMWPLYRDIFVFCRTRKIPMIGLNVPREITRQVASEGFASLTEEQVGELPFIACQVDPEYEEFIREAHGHHMREAAFTRFCEAQLVWDTAMAVHAMEYLESHPHHTLVVLAGIAHAWKKGIPTQIRKQRGHVRQVVILPEDPSRLDKQNVTLESCDYLLLAP